MKVAYTPRALGDLVAIYERGVERWGERIARQVERRVFLECTGLGRAPTLGAPTDLADVRRLPIVRYPFTIFYRVVFGEDRVEILRIVHSNSVRALGDVPD